MSNKGKTYDTDITKSVDDAIIRNQECLSNEKELDFFDQKRAFGQMMGALAIEDMRSLLRIQMQESNDLITFFSKNGLADFFLQFEDLDVKELPNVAIDTGIIHQMVEMIAQRCIESKKFDKKAITKELKEDYKNEEKTYILQIGLFKQYLEKIQIWLDTSKELSYRLKPRNIREKDGQYICPTCQKVLKKNKNQYCSQCGQQLFVIEDFKVTEERRKQNV